LQEKGLFLRNLLLGEKHPLRNRTLHISAAFASSEKVNIGSQKANIEDLKAVIGNAFTAKTAFHVCQLLETFGLQTVFGRSDVEKVLNLKPTRSTALLRELAQKGFVNPVSGLGKGKYRFAAPKPLA
jgi:hypothetical protein